MDVNESLDVIVYDGQNSTVTHSTILGACFLIMAIGGSVCNLIVIVSITCVQALWKPSYFYVLNVACSDFLLCAIYCPFNAWAAISGNIPDRCGTLGALQNFLLLGSICSLAAIAVNRYLLVKLSPDRYVYMYKCWKIIFSIGVIWGISFIFLLSILIGSTDTGYDAVIRLCITLPDWTADHIYPSLEAILVGLPCFVVIFFCYIKVWRIFRKSQKNINKSHSKNIHDSFRLTRNLFIITFIYTMCWLPNLLVSIVDGNYQGPALLHQITSIFAISHSTINPIIYLFLNKNLSLGFCAVIRCKENICKDTPRGMMPHRISILHSNVTNFDVSFGGKRSSIPNEHNDGMVLLERLRSHSVRIVRKLSLKPSSEVKRSKSTLNEENDVKVKESKSSVITNVILSRPKTPGWKRQISNISEEDSNVHPGNQIPSLPGCVEPVADLRQAINELQGNSCNTGDTSSTCTENVCGDAEDFKQLSGSKPTRQRRSGARTLQHVPVCQENEVHFLMDNHMAIDEMRRLSQESVNGDELEGTDQEENSNKSTQQPSQQKDGCQMSPRQPGQQEDGHLIIDNTIKMKKRVSFSGLQETSDMVKYDDNENPISVISLEKADRFNENPISVMSLGNPVILNESVLFSSDMEKQNDAVETVDRLNSVSAISIISLGIHDGVRQTERVSFSDETVNETAGNVMENKTKRVSSFDEQENMMEVQHTVVQEDSEDSQLSVIYLEVPDKTKTQEGVLF